MFRHRGKSRTFLHNLKLASLLSFVAGIVNVSGFFAVQTLTTNVTGHFAFFADEVIKAEFNNALVFMSYIFSFFLGAFMSNTIIEWIQMKNPRWINVIPVTIEILILISIALLDHKAILKHASFVACGLLFAMGLQNALVTSISNSVVRTTHLTGLFTDLGIELSQLFFYKKPEQTKKLKSSIKLRMAIIAFFFTGCLVGGYTYLVTGMYSLLLGAACLITGLIYDTVKFKVVTLKRRYLH
ncbi:YoaK family protein [Rubrolithibacter danxiaensis]|uniref:YoaK family protein n=1 Tax=Rubrolithibacter danxiaensis TaxID=3390805 RepID=UPI003BF7F3BC